MAFCTNVIQLPVPSKLSVGSKATQAAVPLLIGSETPVISVLIDNIIPPCLTRTVLSKALQHSDSTVRYVTSFLLNCVFEKIEAVKREIAEAKLVAAGGITELETKWDVLLSTLISEVKKRVPDVNIIVALHQQQISSLVTLTSSTTTSSSNNARSEDKMEVDDDAFDVTSSSPMQVDSDGQPLDSLENNDTALPLDNSSSDSPELSVSVSLKLLKNYQIHYPNLFLEIRFDHGKLITPSLHTLHPEIQVNLLGLMESVSDFKFWSVTGKNKLMDNRLLLLTLPSFLR